MVAPFTRALKLKGPTLFLNWGSLFPVGLSTGLEQDIVMTDVTWTHGNPVTEMKYTIRFGD